MDTSKTISVNSSRWFQRLDITNLVENLVRESGLQDGQVSISPLEQYTNVEVHKNNPVIIGLIDIMNFLQSLVTRGTYFHGTVYRYTGSDHHSDLGGHSKIIPIIDGKLSLTKKQKIFLLEFMGPRKVIRVLCVFSEKF
jgi:thiamine phosphate synthase YjbQ (UPF0047 family)